jgi:hypothetical protein
MASSRKEMVIEATLVTGLLVNIVGVIQLTTTGLAPHLPPTEWSFVFLTSAGYLGLISGTDIPETIRKSEFLRKQAQISYLWQLALGMMLVAASFEIAVPGSLLIGVAVVFALLSITTVARHYLWNRVAGTSTQDS